MFNNLFEIQSSEED